MGNLKVHLQRLHQLEHGKVEEEQVAINIQKRSTTPPQKKKRRIDSSIPVFLDAEAVIEACVTIVTENGRPFKALDDKGFRMILDPVLIGLGGSLTIGADNIGVRVIARASQLREKMKEELKNRSICLKIDCAKRLGRSILGVNAQFIENGKIRLRTLSVMEIKDRQTGVVLKKLVSDVLKEFDVKLNQVYPVTTDNGANIVLAVKLLNLENENATSAQVDFDSEGDGMFFIIYVKSSNI